jgi:putative cell wall-binding protein
MLKKNYRIRKLLVAALGAATAASGIAALGAIPAGAALPALAGTTVAASLPTLNQNLANQPGGSLAVTLTPGATGGHFTLTVADFNEAANVIFDTNAPTATAPSTVGNAGFAIASLTGSGTNTITVNYTATSATTVNQAINITNIAYDVTTVAATPGPVVLHGTDTDAGYSNTATVNNITPPSTTVKDAAGNFYDPSASNAVIVSSVAVAGDNPPVLVQPNGGGSSTAISPIVLTEATAGAIPGSAAANFVCVVLNGSGNQFLSSGSVTAGTASVPSASGATLGGSGALTATAGSHGFSFQVTKASTSATSYTISGLSAISPTGFPVGTVTATVFASSTAACTSAPIATYTTAAPVYAVFSVSRIFGATADGTAAAELASQFPPPNNCPTSKAVVVATDQNFPDALSASYLAAKLGTGVLLTPTNALASETVTALRVEGINHVYVVGGPLAVAPIVTGAIAQEQAFNCGGTVGQTNSGAPVLLTVTQVYGQTQYDTAQTVAQFFGATAVGTGQFGGGYPTSVTGTSPYNTTSGLSGTLAPTSSAATPTAILATGQTFPDAMAASAMSYAGQWPILLTQQGSLSTQATAAIANLAIKQVIVMGGPIAVSDTVVTQLETLGVSVIRIAGTDYTDTSQLLAQFELSTTSTGAGRTGLDWADFNGTNVYGVNIARGDFFADALAGSAVGGLTETPIVLTFNPGTLGDGIPALFTFEHGLTVPNQVNSITVFGGPIAVTDATVSAALAAIPA